MKRYLFCLFFSGLVMAADYEAVRTAISEDREKLKDMNLSPSDLEDMEAFYSALEDYWKREEIAQARLESYSTEVYEELLQGGIEMLEQHRVRRGDKIGSFRDFPPEDPAIPESIKKIHPLFVRVTSDACFIYLNKGMDTGVGYLVRRSEDQSWKIYSFRSQDGPGFVPKCLLQR
jgi:hypothetical protein